MVVARSDGLSTPGYVLLGLLNLRSWTGYELTQQIQHSLAHTWPISEATVYREQRRLVEDGLATVSTEPAKDSEVKPGTRTRKRYRITDEGVRVLREWLSTAPAAPILDIETGLRIWFADAAGPAELVASLRRTAADARAGLEHIVALLAAYLAQDGAFPERAHLIAMGCEFATDLLGLIELRSRQYADEVQNWSTTQDIGLDPAARLRMQRVITTHGLRPAR